MAHLSRTRPPQKPKKLVAKRQGTNQRGYAAKSSMSVGRAARKCLERATKTASQCRRLRRDLRWSASGPLGAAPKNLPRESRQSFQNGATQSVPRVSGQSKGSAQLMSGGVFGASAAAGGAHGLGFARRQQCQCRIGHGVAEVDGGSAPTASAQRSRHDREHTEIESTGHVPSY